MSSHMPNINNLLEVHYVYTGPPGPHCFPKQPLPNWGTCNKRGHYTPHPFPIGPRHFTPIQGVCESFTNYSLYNKQTHCEVSPIWCYAQVTSNFKALPPIGQWNTLRESDHSLPPIVKGVLLVSRSEVTPWSRGFNCSY